MRCKGSTLVGCSESSLSAFDQRSLPLPLYMNRVLPKAREIIKFDHNFLTGSMVCFFLQNDRREGMAAFVEKRPPNFTDS